jgi:hypothetical protein
MINRLPSLACAQGTGNTLDAIFGKPSFSYIAIEESRSGVVTYTQATSPSLDCEKPVTDKTKTITTDKKFRSIIVSFMNTGKISFINFKNFIYEK